MTGILHWCQEWRHTVLSSDNVLVGSIVVFGKTERRYVKLNSQVQKIINDLELYTKR